MQDFIVLETETERVADSTTTVSTSKISFDIFEIVSRSFFVATSTITIITTTTDTTTTTDGEISIYFFLDRSFFVC